MTWDYVLAWAIVALLFLLALTLLTLWFMRRDERKMQSLNRRLLKQQGTNIQHAQRHIRRD